MAPCLMFQARQIYWSKDGANSAKRGRESGGSLKKPWEQALSTAHRLLKGPETRANSLAGAGPGSLKDEVFMHRLAKSTQ